MSYESRIYFVKEYDFPKKDIHHSKIIAIIDMGKMGYSATVDRFQFCFDTETTFSISVFGYNDELECDCMTDVIEDRYGDRLCYASDKKKLLNAAIKMEKENPEYEMFKQLRKVIQAFVDDKDIKIVHYGY